jgi:C4-dicarboxylate-specific signal transduction histidine kinase
LLLAEDVCRQIAVCADFIGLTVRELDGYLKQTTMPVRLEPLEVRPCVDDARALLAPRLNAIGVTIDRDGLTPGLLVLADRRLLLHAIVNLIKNAAEALADADRRDGVIRLSAVGSAAEHRGQETGPVVIEVADNGPGIPPEIRPRILEDGVSTRGRGRGRGLSIVAESIRRQNGRVEVRDGPDGVGASFRIILPQALAPAPPPSTAGGGPTV